MGSCPPQTLALPKDRSPHSPLTRVQRPPCRLCTGGESRVNSLCDQGAQRLTEEQGQRGWWRGSDHSPRHKRAGSKRGRQGINEREENVCFQKNQKKTSWHTNFQHKRLSKGRERKGILHRTRYMSKCGGKGISGNDKLNQTGAMKFNNTCYHIIINIICWVPRVPRIQMS